MDDTVFAAMSYLHTAFRLSMSDQACLAHRMSDHKTNKHYVAHAVVTEIFFLHANVMMSIPIEYSLFCSIDLSRGMCQRGSMLKFRYMWSQSGSTPHIAFTLPNLTHLVGLKLPQSGGFDPHC